MARIQVRRDSAANWASNNPTGVSGEIGYDQTSDRFKIFDGAASWNGLGWAVDSPFTPPPSTGWSALNSGSVTDNTDSRVLSLAAASGDNWKGEIRTLSPTSNYTATFYFDWTLPGVDFARSGIVLRNSGGSFIVYGPWFNSGWNLASTKWTGVTAFSATYTLQAMTTLTQGMPNWVRIRDDATTRFLEYSFNGLDWALHQSVGRTDFITPDQIGWASNINNAGTNPSIVRLRHLSGVS